MEIFNKYNINSSVKNNTEYNQKYYQSKEYNINPNLIKNNNNKNSSINNIGDIYDEKLDNKKSKFQKKTTNNSSFKEPIFKKRK